MGLSPGGYMLQKKHRIISIAALAIAAVLCFCSFPLFQLGVSAEIDTSEENEAALKAKLEALQKEQSDIKDRLESAKSDISSTEEKRAALDALVTSTQTEIELSEQLIDEYEGKIFLKEKEIAEMEKTIDDRFELLMERLRFSYEDGTATYLALILSADSLKEFLSNSERVESMVEFDKSLMNELAVKLKLLDEEKAALENTKSDQERLRESLIDKKADLEAQVSKANEYILQLRSDEEKLEAELEKVKKEEDSANEEIRKILEERAKTVNPPEAEGDYIWPLPKSYTWISSPYGNRELYGRPNLHRGIDIPAPQGTDIYACNSGVVVRSTWHYSWGNYIVIDHGGGIATLYAHCSRLLVSDGESVERGSVIAKVGETGEAYGAHLHLEFWINNGKHTNPLNYVSKP